MLIDLSHTITPDMPLFSARAPKPEISAWQSHTQAAESDHYQDCTCEISQVSFITSLGTYLDSPYHFHPEKPAIEKLKLEQLVLPGVVVDCTQATAGEQIDPGVLDGLNYSGKAVLFHTGWSRYWGKPQYHQFPFLSEATASALVAGGAKLVGVDCLVVDDLRDPTRPAHVTLLGADILIVENLTNLEELPSEGFTFHAAPVKFAGAAAFPVRAYAVI
jgi:kynurenine formamidase